MAPRPTFFRRARVAVSRAMAAIESALAPWERQRAAHRSRTVKLDDVRRRLELLVTAVYDRPIPIATTERRRSMFGTRWTDPFAPRHLQQVQSLATTDGVRIQLPAQIEAADADTALAMYRVMAIEQAERVVRGTTTKVPEAGTPLERDLYLVREGEIVDESISRTVPGLRSALAMARAMALGARPPIAALTRAERVVEGLVRKSLTEDLTRTGGGAGGPPPAASPDESLEWARERARELSASGGRYRGIAPVAPWGTVNATSKPPRERLEKADELATLKGAKHGIGKMGRGSGKGRQSSDTGQEEGEGKLTGTGELVPRSDGLERLETSGAGEATGGVPESTTLAEAEEARHADTPVDEPEPARKDAPDVPTSSGARRRTRVPAPKETQAGIEYPEWDWEAGDYKELGAMVRSHEPDTSDDTWGNTVLAQHGALVRRLRERFERLRARRARLTQQRDGDELDLTACVRALVDQRTGYGVDDRLYIAVRPARRGLAIALLIDISGSTDEWIDARRRVIDVEKVALLLASEALDALGDLYAILTFSGKGRGNVRMRTVKAFDESNGASVRRRIAALQPEGYTRAGAAIRHATALLERQPAAHRLLLIISDGKPNDVDGYEGLGGVEDTRQAILEARRAGVYPFCLTIDREGQEYLGRIFGEAGHTILRNPQQLPMALVKVVKHLLE